MLAAYFYRSLDTLILS